MTTAEPHNLMCELLGALALDAVDPDEAALAAEHLRICMRCRAELDQLREVAAAIGNSSEPPSGGLWGRIASELGHQAQGVGSSHVGPEHPGAGPGPFLRLHRRPRPRPRRLEGQAPRRMRATAVLGAAACAAIAAVLGIGWVTASTRADQLQHALAQRGAHAPVAAALASPGRRIVRLRSADGVQLAELVVGRNGVGFVVASRMPRLPAYETYQLWTNTGGRPVSIGLLGAEPSAGLAFSLGSHSGAAQLMVTVEPSGGVVMPTNVPVAAGRLA